jgi:hypothetical protein
MYLILSCSKTLLCPKTCSCKINKYCLEVSRYGKIAYYSPNMLAN